MSKIPTARKFLEAKPFLGSNVNFTDRQIEEFLVEFAKLHHTEFVANILEAISPKEENIELLNKVINSYSIENIK